MEIIVYRGQPITLGKCGLGQVYIPLGNVNKINLYLER